MKGAHDNKEAFQRLADDACGLVYAAILCTNRIGTTGVSEDVLDSLRELQGYFIRQLFLHSANFQKDFTCSRMLRKKESIKKENIQAHCV